jgi:hypothetical protein
VLSARWRPEQALRGSQIPDSSFERVPERAQSQSRRQKMSTVLSLIKPCHRHTILREIHSSERRKSSEVSRLRKASSIHGGPSRSGSEVFWILCACSGSTRAGSESRRLYHAATGLTLSLVFDNQILRISSTRAKVPTRSPTSNIDHTITKPVYDAQCTTLVTSA